MCSVFKLPFCRLLLASLLFAAARTADAAASAHFAGDHIALTLVSESDALVPGKAATLGLRLEHEPHWHTYWINPGDSGLSTKLAWHLPDGFRGGDIAWPVPKRFGVGELYNFGYDGEVLLPVAIEVPADAVAGSEVALRVDAKWLVCEEQCIPGKATLALKMPVALQATADAVVAPDFASARAAQPRVEREPLQARVQGERLIVTLPADLAAHGATDAFAVAANVLGNAPPRVVRHGRTFDMDFAKSDYSTSTPAGFDVLIVRSATQALLAHVEVAAAPHP